MTSEMPRREQVYQHYKGAEKLYEVIAIARNADNPNNLEVVYMSLYEDSKYPKGTIWTRSLEEFVGFVMQDGTKIKRFTLLPN